MLNQNISAKKICSCHVFLIPFFYNSTNVSGPLCANVLLLEDKDSFIHSFIHSSIENTLATLLLHFPFCPPIISADLNQVASFNSSYKTNLLHLEHLVLIRFLDDEMVVPSESQLFGFYRDGQSVDIEPLRQNQRLFATAG